MTTRSPTCTPLTTWVRAVPATPSVTRTVDVAEPFATVTVRRLRPSEWIAELGTGETVGALPGVMRTSAPEPSYSAGLSAASWIVTGNVVVDPDVLDRSPIEVTVP